MNYQIFRKQLNTYNCAITHSRQAYFSKLIDDNQNNRRILFLTINRFINPVFSKSSTESSNIRCEQSACHFSSKIKSIREHLSHSQPVHFNSPEPLFLCEEALEKFVPFDAEVLGRVISQLKPATCLLDPIPTFLFKSVDSFLMEDVLTIVNYSYL